MGSFLRTVLQSASCGPPSQALCNATHPGLVKNCAKLCCTLASAPVLHYPCPKQPSRSNTAYGLSSFILLHKQQPYIYNEVSQYINSNSRTLRDTINSIVRQQACYPPAISGQIASRTSPWQPAILPPVLEALQAILDIPSKYDAAPLLNA